ncbi:uncharacterized protein MONBRDRAFT_22463 [Monosiga brevicollis MX1]|uniref:Transcriptional adapter 2-alpha/beta-like domain-containing protein n=1 Tax=Monosiga brevicollis TaxID=81824 RepID=A9UQN2_MONBE|nr:uncharacterized protein MONBRDRAFT_22463 [Monosiga brevicollis MX1]EDQ93074.1 predicted protein [Monosiga brevicollis MX1]|eukprot:XP_001742836.1 hypothetical protein [Monosiga brevicollis MX1]
MLIPTRLAWPAHQSSPKHLFGLLLTAVHHIECRQHYYRCYIDTPNKKLLPVPLAQRTDSAARIEPDEEDLEVPDTTSEHLDPKYRPKLSADFGGFSPIRLDYELEALPDAENLIADVTLHDDDTGPVRKLKLALLAAYAKRLRHRFECHRVAQEYGLCHAKSIDRECMESATLSRICHRLRPFARFHSAIDHKNLLRSFQRRAHFRHQILKLQRFRQVGCRTAEDCQNVDPQSDATALDGPNRKTVRQAHWQRLPYGHDLSKAELSLCQRLMLLPSIYASLKRARVLGTPLKDGIKLDKEKLLQVDSFFQQQGW